MPVEAPPFFIVGSARSGTTLLRLMFNAHPDVAVPPESRFVTELFQGHEDVDVDEFLRELSAHKRWHEWDIPIGAVAEELLGHERVPYRDAIAAAFGAYARAHGKSRWGDKTPRYIESIDLLARLFPEGRFVHLVRDGRNVALSYAHVPFGPKTVGAAAALWSRRVEAGVRAGRPLGRDRYLEVRYEELVADAAATIQDLCGFIGIAFDEGMLDHTRRAREAVLPRASRYNPHVTEPPRKKIRSWEQDMPAKDVEVFEAVAGRTLSLLGYERRFPHPGLRARMIAELGRRKLPVGRLRDAGAGARSTGDEREPDRA
ncbi:MAG: sulfotransferase [Actinomycetota bacterium]|nr:sulfotransferase [Actinomycetota bacterium]